MNPQLVDEALSNSKHFDGLVFNTDEIFMWSSGLDAFQAEKVMETLQKLAQDGHTVICSIHQPRGSVYAKFDDIVLLTEGALVYAGPAGKEPLSYFGNFG